MQATRFEKIAVVCALTLASRSLFARETTPPTPASVPHEKQDIDVGRLAYYSQANPDFAALLDDIAREIALALKPLKDLSPVYVAPIRLSPGLGHEASEQLRFAISRALKLGAIAEVGTLADDRIQFAQSGDDWRVERGGAARGDEKKIAESVGASSILHLGLTHQSARPDKLVVDAVLVGKDGSIVFAQTFESDDRRTLLDRSDEKLQSVDERKHELLGFLAHPSYGHAALIGSIQIPLQVAKLNTNINGLTFAYRLYDTLGDMKDFIFGLQLQGFIDLDASTALQLNTPVPISLAGGIVTAVFGYALPIPDLRLPRVRLGALAGGFIGGSLGNNAAAGGMIELLMRYRLGLNVSVLYIGVTDLSKLFGTTVKLGGVSYMFAGSLNWD